MPWWTSWTRWPCKLNYRHVLAVERAGRFANFRLQVGAGDAAAAAETAETSTQVLGLYDTVLSRQAFPTANNWFWGKAAGNGSAIDAEGAVGGCICRCYSGFTGTAGEVLDLSRFGDI